MSALAGIINFNGTPPAPGLIEGMVSCMVHRGPDRHNHLSVQGATLGHCQLRTTKECLGENQPLSSNDGRYLMVMDGRLDNYSALRKALTLTGTQPRGGSDAELVLQAYLHWGSDCLRRLEGDFALAIWDSVEQSLFCARDPMGSKPFNYHWNGKTFSFASELHAILPLPWVRQILHDGVLAEYLACEFYSRDETLWRGLLRLPPGCMMTVTAAGVKVERYWSPDLAATLHYANDQDYVDHYLELFTRTVRQHGRSNAALAVEVSGGLDSSAIFALTQQLRSKRELKAPGVRGFTLDFGDEHDAGELEYAMAVAEFVGRPVQKIVPGRESLDWYAQQAAFYQEFPGYPNYVMSRPVYTAARAAGAKVLLSGAGGDEWLGAGPVYYAEMLAQRQWRKAGQHFRQDIRDWGAGYSAWLMLRQGLAPFLPFSIREYLRKIRDTRVKGYDRRALLTPDLRIALDGQQAMNLPADLPALRWPGQRGELARLHSAESQLSHEIMERGAAQFGLELRRPYCTTDMVQFSFMVPKRLLRKDDINRWLHRQAMHNLLPEKVLNRHSKAEFSVTYHQHLNDMGALLTEQVAPARHNWVDPAKVKQLYALQGEKRAARWRESQLWALYGCHVLCAN